MSLNLGLPSLLILLTYSTIQEIVLTDEDVKFVAKVTRELKDYLGALEKMK